MTSLFPSSNESIFIKQGKGGDCYLLSSLECLLNTDLASRAQIQSMFTQTNAGVELRIKPNPQSARLQQDKLVGKYAYHKDPISGDDVFIISNQRLKEIDDARHGVQSNSLAVKILERISAYYYVGDWNQSINLASVFAHGIRNRHDKTSTEFVGDLLGFNAHNYAGSNWDKILKLHHLDPHQAIYISMAYGNKDIYGHFHGRHALRLKSFEKIGTNQYKLVLINPWDNRPFKEETLMLSDAELVSRNSRFCVYSRDADEHELKMKLAQYSLEHGKYALANQELFNELLQKKKAGRVNRTELISLIEQHKRLNSPEDLERQSLPPVEIIPLAMVQKTPAEEYKKNFLRSLHDEKRALSVYEELALAVFEQLKLQGLKVDASFMVKHVIEPAAQHHATKPISEGIETERFKIYLSLMIYYFLEEQSINILTRTMQLRSYLVEGVFPKSEINQLIPPKQFAFLTLVSCMNINFNILQQSNSLYSLKDYLQNLDLNLIDNLFIQDLMVQTKTEHVEKLEQKLTHLIGINPNLVQHIIETRLVNESPSSAKERVMNLQSIEGQRRIEQRAMKLLEPLLNLAVLFEDDKINNLKTIRARKKELIDKVNKIAKDPECIAAEDTLRLLGKHSVVKQKIAAINMEADFHEKNLTLKGEKIKILQAINFTSRLNTIEEMKARLVKKAKTHPHYEIAATRAQILYTRLDKIHSNFLNNPTVSVNDFKNEIQQEVHGAVEVLKVHRGWKRVLESLANAILSLAQAIGLKSQNTTWSLLKVKTQSHKTAEEFMQTINKLK